MFKKCTRAIIPNTHSFYAHVFHYFSLNKCELNVCANIYFSAMKHILFSVLVLALSFVASAQKHLFPIKIKDKWGYTNAAGKMVIAAQYDYAESFFEDRAVVALENQPCVINSANKRIIDTGLYVNITRYSEGLAKVTDVRQRQSFVDVNGKKVFDLPADIYDARPFNNGMSSVAKSVDIHQQKFGHDLVNIGYKFGYMNKKGEQVVPFIYDDADDFQNGFARFREGTKFGVLDSLGRVLIPAKYSNLGKFIEGKAIADMGAKFGFIDSTGTEIIKPVYRYAYDFSEGLAAVSVEGKFGYINEKGEMVVKPEYDAVRPFSMGMAAVKKEGKWGFIDNKGIAKLRFVFDDASFFSEGRCAVMIKRKWGFIDERGALVIPAEFDAVGTFGNGLAEIMKGSVSVYISRQGLVIPQLN